MTIIIPSPQLLIHSKSKEYVTQISHREHKSQNLNSNLNSILDDCTINLSLMCFNGVNPAIHQARVYSSVIISDFIELNNSKTPLFYGSIAASVHDFESAIYWYKIAAKRKSITAMNAIGHIYFKLFKRFQNKCKNQTNSSEEYDEEEEEVFENNGIIENNYSNNNNLYKINPSIEALKWFYRAYKLGSVQSIQYIAAVFEEVGKMSDASFITDALHFYRTHYEKTVQYHDSFLKSRNHTLFAYSNSISDSIYYSLYSKYKIGLLFNYINYNNGAFLWFISCAEDFGHMKSIKKMLDIIKKEKTSENKSYDEINSAFFQKLQYQFNLDTQRKNHQIIERNIKLAKIISILKFKSVINSSINNSNTNSSDTNNDKSPKIKNSNTNNSNDNDKDGHKITTNFNDKKNDAGNVQNSNNSNNQAPQASSSSSESLICTDSALDITGWKNLFSLFSAEFLSNSSFNPKQQYSTKPLELPSLKTVSRSFWPIDPLMTNSRNILHYESSLQNGRNSFFPSTSFHIVLKNKGNSSNTYSSNSSINNGKSDLFNSNINSSFSPSFRGKKLALFQSISPAFFASGSKTQYLHFAFKFASPLFSQRNLHLSFLFLQKLWILHPKGVSESILFRNKCKSRNPNDLVRCGFIAILCHDSKFALDLFTKAAKGGNETGSLMTGLLMFHGLNVLRQVKNGCYYLSQCSTDPIALLHLSLACNDDVFEMRAKESLGMYSKTFQYDLSNSNDFEPEKNHKKFDDPLNTNKDNESNNSITSSRCKMYEWVGDLFSNSVKLPLNVGIALMFYGIALKKAEEDGDDISEIIKKISFVSREPVFTD